MPFTTWKHIKRNRENPPTQLGWPKLWEMSVLGRIVENRVGYCQIWVQPKNLVTKPEWTKFDSDFGLGPYGPKLGSQFRAAWSSVQKFGSIRVELIRLIRPHSFRAYLYLVKFLETLILPFCAAFCATSHHIRVFQNVFS